MKILLDTSVWLWLIVDPDRLSTDRLAELSSTETERVLSVGSSWEIAIKYSVGKLVLPEPPLQFVPQMLDRTRTTSLAIEERHVLRAAALPLHHRDPFDRLLIAQAQMERLPILTVDRQFSGYDVELISP